MRARPSLGWFLGFAVIGAALGMLLMIGWPTGVSAGEEVLPVPVSPGAYRPPLHPAVVAAFQVLASLAALLGLDRGESR